jgi:hypothetical protein
MKYFLPFLLIVIAMIIAIIGLIYSFIKSKSIFKGERTSSWVIVINSLIDGISGSAFVFAIIIFGWFSEQNKILTFQNISLSVIVSMIFGVVLFLCSLWRFRIVGNYRGWLFDKFKK